MIERDDVTKLLDEIEENHGTRSANYTLQVFSSMANWHATRSRHYRSPLVKGMRRGKPTKRDRILNDDELRAVWKQAETNGTFGPPRQRPQSQHGAQASTTHFPGYTRSPIAPASSRVNGTTPWTSPRRSVPATKTKGQEGSPSWPFVSLMVDAFTASPAQLRSPPPTG